MTTENVAAPPTGRYSELARLVTTLKYKPGWCFTLRQGATSNLVACDVTGDPVLAAVAGITTGGAIIVADDALLTLIIGLKTPDSDDPSRTIAVAHRFAVPPAHIPVPWERWILERILDVERHEAMEYFEIDGDRPFYPWHGSQLPDGRATG